ncbi:MAG: hypothetical protein IJ455_05690 [Agathobacter sp.]|nr:hypothetical protein [Agathobacter sp.]
MARRGLTGQLNMFDLYNSLDAGEVEMVSLVPDFEEEPVVEEAQENVEEPVVEEAPEDVEEPVAEEAPEDVEEPVAVEIPEITVEPEYVEEKPQVSLKDEKVSMSRSYVIDGEKIEIAYINYNKVKITRGNNVPVIKTFESTKEAVDYYVEQMQELESDE